MTALSVIVPTRNRGPMLRAAVRSIAPQTIAAGDELLIVDSSSTDDTPAVIAGLLREFPGVRTVRSPDGGLLAARHLGADETRGDVMVFVDDDVVAREGWLQSYRKGFADPAVAIAGGPSQPIWEREPPWWIELFRQRAVNGWTIWPLSLIDCGPEELDVPPSCVYGCNFAIRRKVFRRYGGFHPDSVPAELTAWRGDGESALTAAAAGGGERVRHFPGAVLGHTVPASRLTGEYFRWRAFCQGVSESYGNIRRQHGLEPPAPAVPGGSPSAASRAVRIIGEVLRQGPLRWARGRRLLRRFEAARIAGFRFHQMAARDPAVLSWVLRRDYLDERAIPPLPVPAPEGYLPAGTG